MDVFVNEETKEASLYMSQDDYDKPSQMYKGIEYVKEGSNDPLLDAIRTKLPKGFDIDEEKSTWEIVDEKNISVEVSFNVIEI